VLFFSDERKDECGGRMPKKWIPHNPVRGDNQKDVYFEHIAEI